LSEIRLQQLIRSGKFDFDKVDSSEELSAATKLICRAFVRDKVDSFVGVCS